MNITNVCFVAIMIIGLSFLASTENFTSHKMRTQSELINLGTPPMGSQEGCRKACLAQEVLCQSKCSYDQFNKGITGSGCFDQCSEQKTQCEMTC